MNNPKITYKTDHVRGCGTRTSKGVYLVSDAPGAPCEKLPIQLAQFCPCCDQLHYNVVIDNKPIKRSQSHRFIKDVSPLFKDSSCIYESDYVDCDDCSLSDPSAIRSALLIWVGEAFYATPKDFSDEANKFGISRSVRGLPKGFVLGETIVLLAHRNVIPYVEGGKIKYLPGVFSTYYPTRVEKIVNSSTTKEELDTLIEKGLTPVQIVGHLEEEQNDK